MPKPRNVLDREAWIRTAEKVVANICNHRQLDCSAVNHGDYVRIAQHEGDAEGMLQEAFDVIEKRT